MSEEGDQEEKMLVAACPQCGKVARGEEDVKDLFGTRRSGGKLRAQSWCRGCRIRASSFRKQMQQEEEQQQSEQQELTDSEGETQE